MPSARALKKRGGADGYFGSIVSLLNSLNDAIATSRNIAPTCAPRPAKFSFHRQLGKRPIVFICAERARRFDNPLEFSEDLRRIAMLGSGGGDVVRAELLGAEVVWA